MNATHLIEQATRAHSSAGYTGHAALCSTLEAIVRDLCAQLAEARGDNLTASKEREIARMPLGNATVPVEYGYQRETEDEPEELCVHAAYINSHWISARDLGEELVIGWEEELLRDIHAAQAEHKAGQRIAARQSAGVWA